METLTRCVDLIHTTNIEKGCNFVYSIKEGAQLDTSLIKQFGGEYYNYLLLLKMFSDREELNPQQKALESVKPQLDEVCQQLFNRKLITED